MYMHLSCQSNRFSLLQGCGKPADKSAAAGIQMSQRAYVKHVCADSKCRKKDRLGVQVSVALQLHHCAQSVYEEHLNSCLECIQWFDTKHSKSPVQL